MASPLRTDRFANALAGALVGAASLAAGACGFEGTDVPPENPLTVVLDVRVNPNPVAQGDTAVFKAVIRDSTDDSFRFAWSLSGQNTVVTEGPTLRWLAQVVPGSYSGVVSVRKDGDSRPWPNRSFTIVVSPKP